MPNTTETSHRARTPFTSGQTAVPEMTHSLDFVEHSCAADSSGNRNRWLFLAFATNPTGSRREIFTLPPYPSVCRHIQSLLDCPRNMSASSWRSPYMLDMGRLAPFLDANSIRASDSVGRGLWRRIGLPKVLLSDWESITLDISDGSAGPTRSRHSSVSGISTGQSLSDGWVNYIVRYINGLQRT